jgi:hypothetical protein
MRAVAQLRVSTCVTPVQFGLLFRQTQSKRTAAQNASPDTMYRVS